MITIRHTKTKEKITVTNNVAHGLLEKGFWEYDTKQVTNYKNKSYGTGNTGKRKNVSRSKRKYKRRVA